MKKQSRIFFPGLFLSALLLLTGSCRDEPIGPDVPEISVDFTWDIAKMDTSPEMILGNVPPGTASFEVKMYDLDDRVRLGIAQIRNNGSNTIKAGAIAHYQRPGHVWATARYEYSIKAFDQDGKIIGFGKKIRPYPEDE